MSYTNRKQIIFLSLLLFLFLPLFAQNQVLESVKPFSVSIPLRSLSVGINAGILNPSVIIGGSNDFANPQYTIGYGANVRYQLNHYIAFQADFLSGTLKGNQNRKAGVGRPVKSFKTNLNFAGSLSGVITLGNINWLDVENTIVPYISAGLGYSIYKVKLVKSGTTTSVLFNNGSPVTKFFVPVGIGVKINLSTQINLDIGYRMNFIDADNFDGSPYWNTTPNISSTVHKDKFSYGFVGLEFSIGNKSKPKILFDNPAARVNNNLQTQVDVLTEKVDLLTHDTDGDGIPDMYDKEPYTPIGCPVDAHGVSLDSDGDGVPDCRDSELITPTRCHPVDENGVGKCPEADCCINRIDSNKNICTVGDLPGISFKTNSILLSRDAKAILATVGLKLKSHPNCSITLFGYPATSKASKAICNKRLVSVKYYLVKTEGISKNRITTDCKVIGRNHNIVDIKAK